MDKKDTHAIVAGRMIGGRAAAIPLTTSVLNVAPLSKAASSLKQKLGFPDFQMLYSAPVLTLACVLLHAFPRTARWGCVLTTGDPGGATASLASVEQLPLIPVVLAVVLGISLALRDQRIWHPTRGGLWRMVTLGLLAFLICNETRAQEKITVNADFSRLTAQRSPKIGIGVNFLSDSPEIAGALKELNVGCIRYATTEYTQFRPDAPQDFGVAIRDQSLWPVQKFTNTKKWYSKLNFDQFITLCRETNADPCVVLPIDAMIYTGMSEAASAREVVQAAADWVRYSNIEKKYDVRHWEIGNESDIVTNPHVKWTPETYAAATIKLSRAMKAVDPTIRVGINGMRVGKTLPWWDEVLPKVAGEVDFLITHQYSWVARYEKWRVDPSRYDYNVTDAEAALRKHHLDLPIWVTEVSGFNPSQKQPHSAWKALHSFEVIGNVLSHRRVDSAFFWTSKWLGKNDLANDTNALTSTNELTPMGQTLAIWTQNAKGDIAQCADRSGARVWYARDSSGNAAVFVLNRGSHAVDVTVKTEGLTTRARITRAERWESDSPDSPQLNRTTMTASLSATREILVSLPPLSLAVVTLADVSQ